MKNFLRVGSLLSSYSLFFSLSSCSGLPTATPTPSPSTVTSTEPSPSSERPVKGWPDAYSAFIAKGVPASLLAVSKIDFCPAYGSMSESGKRATWATIMKGIALPESSWDRTTQYTEESMGRDPVTGKTVVSEGLLQLSYQDAKNYKTPWCSKFDYARDKTRNVGDRTITDPYINLGCGLEIAEKLMKLHSNSGGVYALGRYWSTMRRGKCAARKFIRENSSCGKEPDGC